MLLVQVLEMKVWIPHQSKNDDQSAKALTEGNGNMECVAEEAIYKYQLCPCDQK